MQNVSRKMAQSVQQKLDLATSAFQALISKRQFQFPKHPFRLLIACLSVITFGRGPEFAIQIRRVLLSNRALITPHISGQQSMNARLTIVVFATLWCAPAFSQRVELYGGAQYEHLENSYNAVGWNAAVTGNFKHVLGITADFSGVYNSRGVNSSAYTYTIGPVLTARLPVVQPFVHVLFGGATVFFPHMNTNAFAILAGGGLDIGLRKGIGLRLVQADWLRTQYTDQTFGKQLRVSAGLVIKF